MNNKINTVIFDVGGVLMIGDDLVTKVKRNGKYHYHNLSVHQMTADALGIDLDQWFDAIDTAYADAITGRISKASMLKTIANNLHISPVVLEKLWSRIIKKHFKKNVSLIKAIKKLRKLGFKTAIISDQFWISDEVLVKNSGIEKFFDVVVVSNRVGFRKPNKKIFVYALKKLKIKPSVAIFVDNRSWNLNTPKNLGLKTLLFVDNKSVINSLNKLLGVKL